MLPSSSDHTHTPGCCRFFNKAWAAGWFLELKVKEEDITSERKEESQRDLSAPAAALPLNLDHSFTADDVSTSPSSNATWSPGEEKAPFCREFPIPCFSHHVVTTSQAAGAVSSTSCFASAPDTSRAMLVHVRTLRQAPPSISEHLWLLLPSQKLPLHLGVTSSSFHAHPASGQDLQVPPLGLACDKASHLAGSCTVGSFSSRWRPQGTGSLLQSGGVLGPVNLSRGTWAV